MNIVSAYLLYEMSKVIALLVNPSSEVLVPTGQQRHPGHINGELVLDYLLLISGLIGGVD